MSVIKRVHNALEEKFPWYASFDLSSEPGFVIEVITKKNKVLKVELDTHNSNPIHEQLIELLSNKAYHE